VETARFIVIGEALLPPSGAACNSVSPMIPESTVQEAISRTNLVELVGRYVELKRAGADNYRGLCLFHNEKSPSFTVSPSRGTAHCYGCGWHGDAIRFLMDHKQIDFPSAVKELATPHGIQVETDARPRRLDRELIYSDPVPAPAPRPAPRPAPTDGFQPRKRPRNEDDAPAVEFDWEPCVAAFDRAAAEKIAAWRGLSVTFVEWLQREKLIGLYHGKVAFPVHDAAGNVVRCHYRLDDGRWMYEPKGGETAPLIIGDPADAGHVFALESQWDGFAVLDQLGYHEDPRGYAAIFTRGATSNTDFSTYKVPQITAVPQNDPHEKRNKKTQRTPAEDWLEKIRETKAKDTRLLIANIPLPWKDANDWIRDGKADPTTVRKALVELASDQALQKLSRFLVNHDETLGFDDHAIEELRPPIIIANFLRRGGVLLLGAESKSRKSWLAQDAALSVATGDPWLQDDDGANGFLVNRATVHIFDLELDASEVKYRFAKTRLRRFADAELRAAATKRVRHYSLDGENVTAIMPLLDAAQPTITPGDLVVIDCLYRLVPDGNEVADVAAILETVKRLARDTQAGIIVVDHFRKAAADKARDRFAGSFVKQASASTLVAIEVKPDDVLELSIDARSFHGLSQVHCRFDSHTYRFRRVRSSDVLEAKEAKRQLETNAWLVVAWRNRTLSLQVTAADAAVRWAISKEAARNRFAKLLTAGLVEARCEGKTHHYLLTPSGNEAVRSTLGNSA
jgi:hypothetical protein